MLGYISSAKVLSKRLYTQILRPPLFLPTYVRASIHTGVPFGLPSLNNYSNGTASTSIGQPHFWSIDSNTKDREYLNARCTTIRPPPDAALSTGISGQATPGELQIEEVQKVSKVKLCRDNGIQPRDLRSLDTDMHDLPSSILVRSESIIFCTRTIRAIIKSDKLIMLESLGSDEPPTKETEERSPILNNVLAHIRALTFRSVHTDHQPFEFTALESLLSQEVHSLSRTSTELTNRSNQLLKSMSSQDVISTAQMQEMIEVKDANEAFLRAATSVKDAVAEILTEPDDMRKMYLTELRNGKVREFGDDDEVELLLETYLKYAASFTLNASRNLQRLNSASQHLTLLLSSTRNRLLHLEIRLAIAMLAVSAAALPGAILGMNLTNHFEDHPWAFYVVTSIIAMIAVTASQAGRAGLRVARRVKMEQAGLLAGGKPAVRPPTNP